MKHSQMRRVLQLNARGGWWYKSTEVASWAENHQVDIVALSESWLCGPECTRLHTCHVSADISVRGWTWTGRERSSHAGGVGFLVRDNIPFRRRYDL